MRISEISSGTYQSQVKRVSIQTISNVEKHENPFIWSKFHRLNSMQSTVTPDIIDIPERTIEKTSVPESSEKSSIFNRNRIIFITIGVLFALSTSITAVALAIKFRS